MEIFYNIFLIGWYWSLFCSIRPKVRSSPSTIYITLYQLSLVINKPNILSNKYLDKCYILKLHIFHN
jgi:hypothetical protein